MNSPIENLESLWETVAKGIDRAGPEHEALFLAKLVLLLGNELQDTSGVERLIDAALRDLD